MKRKGPMKEMRENTTVNHEGSGGSIAGTEPGDLERGFSDAEVKPEGKPMREYLPEGGFVGRQHGWDR